MGILSNSKSFSRAKSRPAPEPTPIRLETKEWVRSSPTQLRMHARCERKWWLKYVAGWPIPFSAATHLGSKIHCLLENYFEHGKLELTQDQREQYGVETPEELALVVDGLQYYPNRTSPLRVEHEILVEEGAVPVVGFIDLIHWQGTCPTVYDHKTTSSWRYTKTGEELAADPQAVVYCKYVMDQLGSDEALFKHVYYLTRPRKKASRVKVTGIRMSREENDRRWLKIQEQLERMAELSKTDNPEEAEPNHEACHDYGGCPFKYFCHTKSKGGKMGIFADIKKSKATENKTIQAQKKTGINPPEASGEASAVVDTPAVKRDPVLMLGLIRQLYSTTGAGNWPSSKADWEELRKYYDELVHESS